MKKDKLQEQDVDPDMDPEYDFSNGERGKYYSPNARFHIPIYLEWELQEKLQSIARSMGKELDEYVDELLLRELSQIEPEAHAQRQQTTR